MPQPPNTPPAKERPKDGQEGDYASGWWGEQEAQDGQTIPGPYGRKPEVSQDAPDLQPDPREKRPGGAA